MHCDVVGSGVDLRETIAKLAAKEHKRHKKGGIVLFLCVSFVLFRGDSALLQSPLEFQSPGNLPPALRPSQAGCFCLRPIFGLSWVVLPRCGSAVRVGYFIVMK